MCNNGCIPPRPGYLERLRELATHYGIVLIFDEVITGFRLGLGGAQEKLNVIPDLVTLGKAVAGGLPLSVVGGKRNHGFGGHESGLSYGHVKRQSFVCVSGDRFHQLFGARQRSNVSTDGSIN